MTHTESTIYTAQGMTCEHCRVAVSAAVSRLEGVESVDVDLATGRVRVVGAGISGAAVAAAIRDEGYEVTP